MGVAEQLGLGDLGSPLIDAARVAWRQWCIADASLAVVAELDELPEWTRQAAADETDVVLGHLAALTAYESNAVTALSWLLIPGATKIANQLRDLHPDIDCLVASQLWVEVSDAHRLTTRRVAGAILARTRREAAADLDVGDLAKRRDRVWAEAVRTKSTDDWTIAADGYESQDELFGQVSQLMMDAMDANAIHVFDAWLIGTLPRLAAHQDVAGHRGRMGLTAPAVIAEVADTVHLSTRAIRRRATTALDRLADYVEARKSPERFAVWRAQQPVVRSHRPKRCSL